MAGELDPAMALVRGLRARGVPVGTGRGISMTRGGAAVSSADLYWAARATLISRRQDIPAFDSAFAEAFALARSEPAGQEIADRRAGVLAPSDLTVSVGPAGDAQDVTLASPVEVLRSKSFADCTPGELAQLARLMARLRLRAPVRLTRRRRAARAGEPDLRRTLRRAMRPGGDPVERAWRARPVRPRRLLLVLDVSGSMSAYSRALAMFAHAALRTGPDWEAFAFGTRLTRMTGALGASTDPDAAFAAAATEVSDWDGGTRIGEALKRLLDEHGRTGAVRGATCVICSDGLEVGDPELLGAQMERLSRLAHRVIWLNPLKGSASYEPLARGMAAALPHIDVFRAGHNLQSLEEVAEVIQRAG